MQHLSHGQEYRGYESLAALEVGIVPLCLDSISLIAQWMLQLGQFQLFPCADIHLNNVRTISARDSGISLFSDILVRMSNVYVKDVHIRCVSSHPLLITDDYASIVAVIIFIPISETGLVVYLVPIWLWIRPETPQAHIMYASYILLPPHEDHRCEPP